MNYSSPIKPREYAVRRTRPSRGKAESGRFLVFFIFLWLRMIDGTTVGFLYPRLSAINKQYFIISLVTTAVWTTGLLLAIWFRQIWARYVLVVTLLLAIISTLSMIPGLPDAIQPEKVLYVILGVTGVYLPVALILILSKSIHRLTSEKYRKQYE